jgi:hypothetical protein
MTTENEAHAQKFQKMHDNIVHNVESKFGGAAVIVPPSVTGNEQPIELLMLDTSGDPAQFLATLLTRIQQMMRQIDDQQRMAQGFRG